MATIDIIVPCYNYGHFLHSCIDSVIGQQECEVRILIVDDASTDNSLEVARRIAAENFRVQVRAHEINRGHIATYNEGIDWLNAEYMLLLSADDILAPHALSRAVSLMEANPRISFVYGTSIQFTEEADIATKRTDRVIPENTAEAMIEDGTSFIRRVCARPDNPVETATAVVRSAKQKRVGGYRPELPHAGDLEMWLRLAAEGSVGFVPAVQAFTRIHAGNMRHRYKAERMQADYQQRQRAFEIFFEMRPGTLKGAEDLSWVAKRSLAVEVLWAAACCFEEKDDLAAAQLVELAKTIDSSIIHTSLWWKTAVKRALGRPVWRAIAPVLASLRSKASGPQGRGATSSSQCGDVP